jgi:hypothetical protein
LASWCRSFSEHTRRPSSTACPPRTTRSGSAISAASGSGTSMEKLASFGQTGMHLSQDTQSKNHSLLPSRRGTALFCAAAYRLSCTARAAAAAWFASAFPRARP